MQKTLLTCNSALSYNEDMQRALQLALSPIYPAERPVRNARNRCCLLERRLCIVCRAARHIDPCQTGPHRLSREASDLRRLPLCLKHHNEVDQVPADFFIVHSSDISTLIQLLNRLCELRQRKPA